MCARFKIQLPRKCTNEAEAEPTLVNTLPVEEQIKEAMRVVCGTAPTIDILHAVFEALQEQWRSLLNAGAAVDYLRAEKYVELVSRSQVLAWHIEMRSPERQQFWFSKAWLGLFSNYILGFMCGAGMSLSCVFKMSSVQGNLLCLVYQQ